ncbi:hypothetical protein [Winogradskyella sp. 3972H.M.0a.05]|uniref:hypothetical protein n=1 Tax=Winogradskyella sp. 3972H.M.0a.05 TaxID=2950277 RepID=UPI003398511F
MTLKLRFLFTLLIANTFVLFAQETVNLSGYNGSGFTVTATSTVNDDIIIVFEDVDIIQNFYTQFQDQIYMYGGLDTVDGPFQGAPDFNDYLVSHPVLVLIDGDNNAQPNTYSIIINLADEYSSVPDGTMVFGFNLLFQNQFGGLGQPNNQTENLYIDLTDAMKDSTLSIGDVNASNNVVKYFNDRLFIPNATYSEVSVKVYDLLGKMIYDNKNLSVQNSYSERINLNHKGVKVIIVETEDFRKVIKAID